jgi:predicted metal-dependent hydrolase
VGAHGAEEGFGVSRATLVPLERTVPVEVFKAEVRRWADRIGVEAKEIHVRDMTRKWASCSSRGRLTFDVDLLREPTEFRSEVIVHELVHLKVPNHGKLFRNLVRSYLGRELAQARERVD